MRKSTASKRENRGDKKHKPPSALWDEDRQFWDGKYDEYGAHRPMDIAGSAMPMRKIVNEAMNSGNIAQFIGQLSLKPGDGGGSRRKRMKKMDQI